MGMPMPHTTAVAVHARWASTASAICHVGESACSACSARPGAQARVGEALPSARGHCRPLHELLATTRRALHCFKGACLLVLLCFAHLCFQPYTERSGQG